jgi:hypothetical protein
LSIEIKYDNNSGKCIFEGDENSIACLLIKALMDEINLCNKDGNALTMKKSI